MSKETYFQQLAREAFKAKKTLQREDERHLHVLYEMIEDIAGVLQADPKNIGSPHLLSARERPRHHR